MLLSIPSKALSIWSWISLSVAWVNAEVLAAKERLAGEVRFVSF